MYKTIIKKSKNKQKNKTKQKKKKKERKVWIEFDGIMPDLEANKN